MPKRRRVLTIYEPVRIVFHFDVEATLKGGCFLCGSCRNSDFWGALKRRCPKGCSKDLADSYDFSSHISISSVSEAEYRLRWGIKIRRFLKGVYNGLNGCYKMRKNVREM